MLTHLTDTITTLITNLYITTGLIGIVFAMALESCLIPLPSEIVMPLAGGMVALSSAAGAKHLLGVNPSWPVWLSLLMVALAGAVGCLIGSIAAYGIGHSGGRTLLLKYGRYVLISQHDAAKADRFFLRYGGATTFFSRLLPVIRTYISLPAGIARMPFAKFCIYTLLGSLPWCLVLAYVGYVLGNHWDTLGPIFHDLDVVIVVGLVILVVLYVWRHLRNDRKARAELAASEAAVAQQAAQNAWQQQQWGQAQQGQPLQMQQQGQWGQHQQRQFQQPQAWREPQPQQPPQQGWGQQPLQQGWPQQPDDDRTIRPY